MGVQGAGPAADREFELASRLAAIVESSDDAVIGKTLDGTITSWNAGAARMYGYPAGEMVGRNVSVLVPPDRPGELAPILGRLGRGERVEHFETKRCRKDGSIIDVSVSISPIRDRGGAVIGASTVARDMTESNLAEAERRAVEQQRQQSEDHESELASRLAAIVESASVAIIGAALDHVVTSWNSAAEHMLGYTPDEMIGRDVSVIVPPDQAARIALNYERLRRGERIDYFETQLRRKDGTIIDVSVSVSPILAADGAVVGVSSLARDVTERHRAEAGRRVIERQRQQAERREFGLASRLAAIVESSADAIISATLDGVVTSWNAGAERVFGYAASETVGRTLPPALTPARHLASLLERIARGERIEQLETKRRRKDGSIIDVSISVSSIRDPSGTVVGISSVTRDVTERHRAEAERRVIERQRQQAERREFALASRLAAIVESAADAIIGATTDGVITSWNAGAERMFGYAADETVGRRESVPRPPDRAGDVASILERIRRGERVENFETKRFRKDGSIIDVSMVVSPILDASGAVVGVSSVTRDVTERNRTEQRLHQSERLESLGQLAGGIAHDFNNLLAVIMNYAEFVAEDTADRPAVLADVEQIQAAAQSAARLTRQLLIFSRRETVQAEALDLGAIVADIRNLLSRSIGAHIELRVEPSASLPAIEADRGQVEQVLLNLAINARDAMPGGGTLTIGTSLTEFGEGDTRLRDGVSPGRYVELAVSDTGTGMSADVAARIFEPFFTTKPRDQGTGLGLATVYGIVTQAGGGMSVDSEEGAGTTFRLYFPAAAPASAATPAMAGHDSRGNGETILVVEDEPAVLEVTSRILRQNGYTTLEAGTFEEALSLAASSDFQLLLTDSVMPRMSGATLAERVAELRPGLPVLYMSGYSEGAPAPQYAIDKEAARLQKPFDQQTLLEKVHTALNSPRMAPPGGP